MDENPIQQPRNLPSEKPWERTTKNKKFLKKPNNKTSKKQFFKELIKNSLVPHPEETFIQLFDLRIRNDLETCAKIFEFADLSKKLDLEVLMFLTRSLCVLWEVENCYRVEICFEYARHDLLTHFVKILIKLKETAIAGEGLAALVLLRILFFFNSCASYKRGRNLLRNTENFEAISEGPFLQDFFFHSTDYGLSIQALELLVLLSKTKFLTQEFVEKYVTRVRELVSKPETDSQSLQSISQKILESEHGTLYQKLISELPEEQRSKIMADDPEEVECFSSRQFALVRCANCRKEEEAIKEFKKCSRCNSVYYCSKACQKSDWSSHKNICN